MCIADLNFFCSHSQFQLLVPHYQYSLPITQCYQAGNVKACALSKSRYFCILIVAKTTALESSTSSNENINSKFYHVKLMPRPQGHLCSLGLSATEMCSTSMYINVARFVFLLILAPFYWFIRHEISVAYQLVSNDVNSFFSFHMTAAIYNFITMVTHFCLCY